MPLLYVGLDQHQADPATIKKLRSDLRQAALVFGDVRIDRLVPANLAAWRASLSPGARHGVFRSLKQVLRQAVAWQMLERNPADGIRNPKPKAPEIQPFESWKEIDAIAVELGPRFGPDRHLRRGHRAQAGGVVGARAPRRRP